MPSDDVTNDYVARVNRAIDYVLGHLEESLPLEVVAKAAHFSPFHFHRIFRGLMGETLYHFVKRVRLERALRMLTLGKKKTLTEIALACGFASSADFSRSFKQRYGKPPSEFDAAEFRAQRREAWQEEIADNEFCYQIERLSPGENPDGFAVTMRDLPARTVAYIRVLDPFRDRVVVQAAERLVEWADARGFGDGAWLGYMWDDPEIVARADCRYDVGVVVPDVKHDGEIGRYEFPAMQVAEVEVRGGIDLEQRAIDWIFGTWLPSSGYEPTSQPCFEAWIGRPFAHGFAHFELHAQVPVRKV